MKLKYLLPMAAVVIGTVACGSDPYAINPDVETVTDTLTVFAISGTSTVVPTAVNTSVPAVVRTEIGSGFEVVFDINSAGQVVLLPQQLVALSGRTGMQKVATPFDSVLIAPTTGYDETNPQQVNPGQTVIVRAVSVICAGNTLRPYIYSKMVVDSVQAATRAIYFRIRVDRNCGFRSFKPGLPTE